MSENKYGNLLDKYTGKGNGKSNSIMDNYYKNKREEGKGRYGTLLDNVDKLPTIYDKMLDVENATREKQRKDAEKQAEREQEIKAKHEREKQELEARREQNTAFVEGYLAKKEADQKAINEKKKKEAEQAEIYRNIEKLMETSPEAAKAYADIYANKLKMV